MKNLRQWNDEYANQLRQSVTQNYGLYAYDLSEVPAVAGRMAVAFERGSYNKDSHAIRATCHAFKIKHTYKAIDAFLRGI